jgi:uncharacterized protein YcbK (DUF882 family)
MSHNLIQSTQLTAHFNRSEFACKCGCGFSQPDPELLGVLEMVRSHFKKPVTINSACRCVMHNANEGGSKNSAHLQGIAADIDVKDTSAHDVHKFLFDLFPGRYGLGKYDTFTHIDVRKIQARWG